MSIFAVLAFILPRKPHVLASELPSQWKQALPLTVWMIKQASQGNLHVGLYLWVHYLLPLLNTDPQWRCLILELVEIILEKPGALTELENHPFWREQCLIPPCSFEILLRHRFSATSRTEEDTRRFVKIYGSLKRVALAGARKRKAVILQIFTISLGLAGEEGNPVLAKEAANMAIWSLTRNLVCWRIWYRATKENLAASVVLLKALIEKWNEHSIELPSSSPRPDAMSEFIQRIFTISIVVAGEGNTVLASEATEIAIWSLAKNFFWWTRWDYLLDKVNLQASLVILKTLVRDFEAHSSKLSSSSEGITKFILRIFTISLRIAGEGHHNLAREAVAIAIWALTKNIFGWKRWDYLYDENLKASVVLLERLVGDSEYDFLKLSSSDTLTVSQTIKSFLIKNNEGITAGGANGNLYEEADKYCKVLLASLSLSPGNCFLIKNNEGITAGGANGNLYEEADKYWKVLLQSLSPGNCFLIKKNEGITAGGANGNLCKEADKSCKAILGRLSPGNCSSLRGLCITGVVLVLGTVLILFVLAVFGFISRAKS